MSLEKRSCSRRIPSWAPCKKNPIYSPLPLRLPKKNFEKEGRECAHLQNQVAQLQAAQEAERVPEVVSEFLGVSADTHLKQTEIARLVVPMAFTLHVPVERAGVSVYKHHGGVLQGEATSEISMLALELLLKEVFVHITRRAPLEDNDPCPTNLDVLAAARSSAASHALAHDRDLRCADGCCLRRCS
jgi:hypothetical protein